MACCSIQTVGGMSRHTIILRAVKTSYLLCHKTTLSNIQTWRCVLAQSKPLLWGECHRKTIISSRKHDQCFITLCFSHCSSAKKEHIHQISDDIYFFSDRGPKYKVLWLYQSRQVSEIIVYETPVEFVYSLLYRRRKKRLKMKHLYFIMWDMTSNDQPCNVDQKCEKYKQSKGLFGNSWNFFVLV